MSNPKPPQPTHVLVVEDAPHVHKALIDGCGVRPYGMARAGDEETILRPGMIAFDIELPWTDLCSLTARLRELLRLEPDAIFSATPANILRRCEERGVPVHTIPSKDRAPRTVRVLILDATAVEQRPTESAALRATPSGVHMRVPSPSDPAPLRRLG